MMLTRADGNVTFPARFVLVAASNPCPCGYFGDEERECTCTVPQIRGYQNRIGGPLIDRIDLHLDVRRIRPAEILERRRGTSSAQLREGVMAARDFASWRASQMAEKGSDGSIEALADGPRRFMVAQAELHAMSGRAITRTLAVARTIADLAESQEIESAHIAEAVNFRVRDGIGGK